jgi:hypothetical protein
MVMIILTDPCGWSDLPETERPTSQQVAGHSNCKLPFMTTVPSFTGNYRRLGFRIPIESVADDFLHGIHFAISKLCKFVFASFPAERAIVLAYE